MWRETTTYNAACNYLFLPESQTPLRVDPCLITLSIFPLPLCSIWCDIHCCFEDIHEFQSHKSLIQICIADTNLIYIFIEITWGASSKNCYFPTYSIQFQLRNAQTQKRADRVQPHIDKAALVILREGFISVFNL